MALLARTSLLVGMMGLLALSACAPKVMAPAFEEDDPRAARDPKAAPAGEREGDRLLGGEEAAAPTTPAPAPADQLPPAASRARPLAPLGKGQRTGAIDRLALLRVLDAGPGGLLRSVELSPSFEGSRFLGWRLDQIVDATSPLAAVDLLTGDILLAVNRRPIARPEHVMAIWQELRGADELICQVWRGDAAFELRFAITPKATKEQAAPMTPPPRPAPTAAASSSRK